MARYIGPKTKIARSLGSPVYGYDKYYEKKNYPPGLHGLARKRRKPSEYRMQLLEKQKAKYTYGVQEAQFRRFYQIAISKGGVTGENLMQILESRLDNVVYRLGIAKTRPAARQLVTHKHITVNGVVVNVPSFMIRPGDVIGVREKSKSLFVIQESLAARVDKYSWLQWDQSNMEGTFLQYPVRAEIPENINEQLIVELYSK
ncbi:MAG: 30S ribosomal protein S4 [Bacteroidetes bacterium ADurb.Bin035]|jgi:small subunit ribosomal protein S4|nr:MAG: 30S ribosomal protein S4 [Bacteroidetes bacterium ADurb.Bin035]HNT70275.1 30S ribosomal protein S4 [Bacteroidales bacterium]HNY75134.1 30S ribosomal protein S4 [Bacteroidales bacterium]HOC39783.1 30S ribosomal protein S4 [Bacteroidales bacterium]HOH93087.1 30S ribosomal protein S4 [Bacteroidales bacterium]